MGLGIWVEFGDWGWGFWNGDWDCNWDQGSGLDIAIGDWNQGFGLGIEIGGWRFESGIGIEQQDYNRRGVEIEMTINIE